MDTHAHHLHNAPGKNIWHYFFEFFMLFLAVFCGFLVENFREKYVEINHAGELAKNFYEELKSDSATAVVKVRNRIKQENALKYCMAYFKDSSLSNVSKRFALNFQYGVNFRTLSIFEPRTVVLEQLKNSGSLRYFKSHELQKYIGDLTVAIKNIIDRQDLESKVRFENLNPLLIQNQDFDYWIKLTDDGRIPFDKAISDYEKSDSIIPFHFKGLENFDRNSARNILAFYCYNAMNSTRQVHIQKYIDLNAALLKILRREYDLE